MKWTFGEMIFTGPNSGATWGLSQIVDAYKGIAALSYQEGRKPDVTIRNGTAAYLEGVSDKSVDMVCMDPPYYNNVQYTEFSDYFYVWQRRTLHAISSIFITCRKRPADASEAASWTGFGGSGVAQRIRKAVAEGLEEFATLGLNPEDEMVSSYGLAL
jgi:adenine-specific DNA methylase